MKRRAHRIATISQQLLVAFALTMLFACSTGPTYQQELAQTPPPAPNLGRIVIYLPDSSEMPTFYPQISVDGVDQGQIRTGSFFFVDRPAGVHQVGVYVRASAASGGMQGATEPVAIAAAGGTTSYVQVRVTLSAGMVLVQLLPEDPMDAQRDLQTLHFAAPLPPS